MQTFNHVQIQVTKFFTSILASAGRFRKKMGYIWALVSAIFQLRIK